VRKIIDPEEKRLTWDEPERSSMPQYLKDDPSLLKTFPELGIRLSPNPVVTNIGTHVATAMVPVNPKLSLKAGTYKFEVYGMRNSFTQPAPGRLVSGYAILKPKSNSANQALNLALHFAGKLGAERAKTDSQFQSNLNTFKNRYAKAGITVNQVSYHSLDSKFGIIECDGKGNPGQETWELMSQIKVDGAVNVAIIDSFAGACASIGGVAGNTPGPLPGNRISGVIVARTPTTGDGKSAANMFTTNFVHEVGHYLGLFHTTDMLEIDDPISDTKSSDFSNPMYWMSNVDTGYFSAQQAQILRLHPMVYPLN
jgi:hypothetical protein